MSLEFDIYTKYLGVPFKHGGRDLDGLDCWGLIKAVYQDLGHSLLDVNDYSPDWADKGANYFVENYHLNWEKVERPSLFDVVLFHNQNGVACHAGLYISEGRMMHASAKLGVVIVRVNKCGHLLEGYYRLKK